MDEVDVNAGMPTAERSKGIRRCLAEWGRRVMLH
jgi:hypothetical protein